jgi:hypothetical protein
MAGIEDIEFRRDEILGRLNYFYLQLCDQRRTKTVYDLLLLRWLLQSNIGKLEKLSLPDNDEVINEQIEVCEKCERVSVSSNRADLAERFHSMATSLRIKRLQKLDNITQ